MISSGYGLLPKALFVTAISMVAACDGLFEGDTQEVTMQRAVVDATVPDIVSNVPISVLDSIRNDTDLTSSEVQNLDALITPIGETLAANNPITAWGDVPTTGSASYIGGLELRQTTGGTSRVFGTLRATANFADETITGTARNFRTDDDVLHPSSDALTLDAEFFPDNNLVTSFGISGALTGTLSGPTISGPVDVDINADFADEGSVIYGGGEGQAGGNDVSAALIVSED